MRRITILLSVLSLSLSMGACTDKGDTGSGPAAANSVPAGDEPEAAAKTMAEEPRLDTWKALSPFIIGSYSATCGSLSSPSLLVKTITVNAGGKAGTDDILVDYQRPEFGMVTRQRDDKGRIGTMVAMHASSDKKDGALLLSQYQDGKDGSASVGRQEMGYECAHMTGGAALNATPLFETVTKVVDVKKQTLHCTSITSPRDIKYFDLDVEVDGNIVKVGGTAFDTTTTTDQTYTMQSDGSALEIGMHWADDRLLIMSYDRFGKVHNLQSSNKSVSTHSCAGD